jgi:hypothetical protein
MRLRKGTYDRNHLLADLGALQLIWKVKTAKLAPPGRGSWMHGVVFGIETGRRSIEEQKESSIAQLEQLLGKWERIVNLKRNGHAAKSIKGIDFGIRLVVRRVRLHLKRRAHKRPKSADGGKAPLR